MDPRIEVLKSTTFFGKRPARCTIARIQEAVELLPKNSRRELAPTIRQHLDWRTRGGGYREQLALRALEKLEALGIPELPAKHKCGGPRKRAAHAALGPGSGERLRPEGSGVDLPGAGFRQGGGGMDRAGRPPPLSPLQLADRSVHEILRRRRLGCLVFKALGALTCRDEWIGWAERRRRACRCRVGG
ncbi:MAG: hypothetical protein OXN84_00795 [Albidovulum sp.]|nr:hypothetical protein [Albidovulum sp.]